MSIPVVVPQAFILVVLVVLVLWERSRVFGCSDVVFFFEPNWAANHVREGFDGIMNLPELQLFHVYLVKRSREK